jgi:hypothetical protein
LYVHDLFIESIHPSGSCCLHDPSPARSRNRPAGTTSPGGETLERDWAALELEVLHDLARIGTAISEQLNQGYKATAAALPAGSPARVKADREVALAFMRLSRAVRLTMAMFGRVRQAREALAAGTASPAGPAMPPTGSSQRAIDAMVRALEARTLDFDAEADDFDDDDLDDEEDLFDDLYDGPDPADAPDRPDRESLTELADFGFSLDRCGPGEVIAGSIATSACPRTPPAGRKPGRTGFPPRWPAPSRGRIPTKSPTTAPRRHPIHLHPIRGRSHRPHLPPRPARPHPSTRPCDRPGGAVRPKTAADRQRGRSNVLAQPTPSSRSAVAIQAAAASGCTTGLHHCARHAACRS